MPLHYYGVPGEVVYNTFNNRGLYDTSYRNFAPRIGVAYQAREKMVWRAGYGIFYVPNYYGQGPNTGYSQTTPWVASLNGGLKSFLDSERITSIGLA